METIKPFREEEKFTRVHNYLFDVVMPSLKPNAWKVLCFVIRQTIGWKDREGGRKQTDQLSYSQLRKGTGIASDMTLHAALKELLKAKLVKCQKGKHRDAHTYGLNLDYEAITTETVEHEKISTTETVAIGSTEIVVHSTTETVDTKERRIKESIKENGGGNKSIATDNPPPPPLPTAAVSETDSTAQRPTAQEIVAPIIEQHEKTKAQEVREYQARESEILAAFGRLNTAIRNSNKGYQPITGTRKLAEQLARRGETEASMKAAWETCKTNGIKPMGAFMKWIQEGYLPPQQEGHETQVIDGVVHVWVDLQGWQPIGKKAT